MSTAKFDTIGQYLLKAYMTQVLSISLAFRDYVLGFYDLMIKSPSSISYTREDSAAFAADGYARCWNGALAVTYV